MAIAIVIMRRGDQDYLARVDVDGVRGRIGCRATSASAAFIGATDIAAEVVRARGAQLA
jgi:hypothetical protein